jgi:uncharacterized membrane protein
MQTFKNVTANYNTMMEYAIALVTLFVMDLSWISSQSTMYGTMVKEVQGSNMTVNPYAAIIAYAFVTFSFFAIVVPAIESSKSLTSSFCRGAIIGLLIYGVYNATNMSIFTHYNAYVAVVDTLWGTLLFGTVAAAFTFAKY